jgi:hypothetical protein
MPELRYLDLQFLVEKGHHEACFLFTKRLCQMSELPTSLESLTLRALCFEEDTLARLLRTSPKSLKSLRLELGTFRSMPIWDEVLKALSESSVKSINFNCMNCFERNEQHGIHFTLRNEAQIYSPDFSQTDGIADASMRSRDLCSGAWNWKDLEEGGCDCIPRVMGTYDADEPVTS